MSRTPTTSAEPARREQWTGQYGFILAAIGSAVGLGNIWRFPGVAYTNGGGAFLIPYLVALLTAGIPILLLDYSLGHRFRGSAPTVFRRINKNFEVLGWLQVLISFVIITYYAVILAWALRYTFYSVTEAWGDDPMGFFVGDFLQVGDPAMNADVVPGIFWPLVGLWVVAAIIMALGITSGLERANRVFMPVLLVIFLTLVVRALFLPGAADGLNEFFTPNWQALGDPQVWIAAYSQIFFSLSVAFGIMLTYSSYLKRRSNLVPTGLVTGFANSSFEILAGFGVFATLGFLAHKSNVAVGELEGITGPILSFVTFPSVISMMPGGPIFGVIFFASLSLAGFTSLISLLQVVSAAMQEKFGLNRRLAALLSCGITGVLSVILFSTTNGLNALDVVDKFINEIGIVSSAILMTLLVSYAAKKLPELLKHLNHYSTLPVGKWWYAMIGGLAPAVLSVIFVATVYSLVTEGYGGYPESFIYQFGWTMLLLVVIASFTLSVIPWKVKPDDFDPVDYHEDGASAPKA
ncbi:MAG: sodium-dependent transporter [Bowdeniella nasicola]|nr:sodium-dependent transporter [Bowdeniella nasicola]